MKRLPRSTFALAALALFSGCMYSPVNGSTVPSRGSTVPFEGFLFQGSKSVMVEARGSAQGNWVPFAYPNSSDTARSMISGLWRCSDVCTTDNVL